MLIGLTLQSTVQLLYMAPTNNADYISDHICESEPEFHAIGLLNGYENTLCPIKR